MRLLWLCPKVQAADLLPHCCLIAFSLWRQCLRTKVPHKADFWGISEASRLVGKSNAVAVQACGVFHTMAVLQAYQADLLKDLDQGEGLFPTDLALRATKRAAFDTPTPSPGMSSWREQQKVSMAARAPPLRCIGGRVAALGESRNQTWGPWFRREGRES